VKIVVLGGTGLIGAKLVNLLRARRHTVVAGSPRNGVNAVTGEGLADVLRGAAVVVDVTNSPSFEDQPVMEFFQSSGRNLAAAERVSSVIHHVALSVVGTPRLQSSGYFRAKLVQEQFIRESGIPFTIVYATQFFEFIGAIANAGGAGPTVNISSADFQPIASDDVALAMADAALGTAVNGVIEIAGPERMPISDAVSRYLAASNDPRQVVGDPATGYFGVAVDDGSLVPAGRARLGTIRLDSWLAQEKKVA
jgi:uncharacterized protein YbjT (DUF2867 family)